MKTLKLNLLVLRTRQVEKLRRFYATMGIGFVEERHGWGPMHFAGRLGDLIFELYPISEENGPIESSIRLGLVVGDLEEAIQSLEAIGVPVVTRPRKSEWGLRAVVHDPDGRAVELYQE